MTILVSLLPGTENPEIRFPKSMILANVNPRPDMLEHYKMEVDVEKRSSDPEFMKQFMDHMMNSQQQKPSDVDKPENEEEDVEVKDIITDMLESVIEMISNEEMTKEMIEEYYSKALFIQESIRDMISQNKIEEVGGSLNNVERILKTNSNNLLELVRSKESNTTIGRLTFYFLKKTIDMNLQSVEEMHRKLAISR